MKRNIFLAMIFLVFVINFNIVEASSGNNLAALTGNAYQMAKYFCNNLGKLEEDYARYGHDVSLDSCEYKKVLIEKVDSSETGYLVDFNDDNGYFLIGDNNQIYDSSLSGKSFIDLKLTKGLVYNQISGQYKINNQQVYLAEDILNIPTYTAYDGTANGVIINDLAYIHDRYGDDFYLNSFNVLYTGDAPSMGDLSVYTLDGNTEKSCGLVAAYNYLIDLRARESMGNLPVITDNILYEPSSQELWVFIDRSLDGGYFIYTGSYAKSFTSLYIESRLAAIEETGDVEGISLAQSKDIIENVVYSNGYTSSNISFANTSLPSFTSIRNHIDGNETMVFSVFLHPVYDAHSMFATGYKIYRADRTFLGFPCTIYKNVITLRDGWYHFETYFDFSAFSGGICGIITANTGV